MPKSYTQVVTQISIQSEAKKPKIEIRYTNKRLEITKVIQK